MASSRCAGGFTRSQGSGLNRWQAPLAAALLATLTFATSARANGRYPIAGQFAVSPGDPNVFFARATFGVLVSRDGGFTWDWICEPAIGYSDVSEDPTIGVTASAVLVGMFEGLAVSPDGGCSWSTPLIGPMTDLVVRRDNSHAAFALASSYQGRDDAGQLSYASLVYSTEDDGAHWTTIDNPIDPRVVPETIDVAGDGSAIYVSGYENGGGLRAGAFFRSTDGGAHYTRSTIDLSPLESAPFIGAVDPNNAMRVYVRVAALASGTIPLDASAAGERLLVTDDGGQSFRTVFSSAGPLLGFALSPDGSKVYVGGPADGVLVADRASLSFVAQSSLPVQCLASTAGALFACSDDNIGFLLGMSTDDGASFTPVLRRNCVRGALACPASASAAQCGPLFGGLAPIQVGTGGPLCTGDSGVSDAASRAASSAQSTPRGVPTKGSTSGCDAARDGGSGLGSKTLALLAGALVVARSLRMPRGRLYGGKNGSRDE